MALRAPNEIPGRPTSVIVPTWSENDHPERRAKERRLAVEWRKRHPSWWRRLLGRRPEPTD